MRTMQKNRCLQFALIALMLSIATALAAQTPQWKPFGAANDGFQALFPSTPEVSRTNVPAGADTYELRSYVAEVGSTAFYIGVCDYGVKGGAGDPDDILAKAEKGAVEHVAAHILSASKITLDTSPGDSAHLAASHGLAFEAENDKIHFSIRMYMSAGVLYQVMVTSPLSEKFADSARFLDSFQLLDRAAR